MGLLGSIKGLFTGSPQVRESHDEEFVKLAKQILRLSGEMELLRQEVSDHKAAFNVFRGRVYAWKRFEPPPEAPEEPKERSLSDPRLTKAEVKARLLEAGKLVPGRPFKHN